MASREVLPTRRDVAEGGTVLAAFRVRTSVYDPWPTCLRMRGEARAVPRAVLAVWGARARRGGRSRISRRTACRRHLLRWCAQARGQIRSVDCRRPATQCCREALSSVVVATSAVARSGAHEPWPHGRRGASGAEVSVAAAAGASGRALGRAAAVGAVIDCTAVGGSVRCSAQPAGARGAVTAAGRAVAGAGVGAPVDHAADGAVVLVVQVGRAAGAGAAADCAAAPGNTVVADDVADAVHVGRAGSCRCWWGCGRPPCRRRVLALQRSARWWG